MRNLNIPLSVKFDGDKATDPNFKFIKAKVDMAKIKKYQELEEIADNSDFDSKSEEIDRLNNLHDELNEHEKYYLIHG